jgi:predicted DNA-binding transcriptional regulator AlpA
MPTSPTTQAVVPELLTLPQAAALVGMGARSLHRHAHDGRAPKPLTISRGMVRWRRSELLAWIADGCPQQALTPCPSPASDGGPQSG